MKRGTASRLLSILMATLIAAYMLSAGAALAAPLPSSINADSLLAISLDKAVEISSEAPGGETYFRFTPPETGYYEVVPIDKQGGGITLWDQNNWLKSESFDAVNATDTFRVFMLGGGLYVLGAYAPTGQNYQLRITKATGFASFVSGATDWKLPDDQFTTVRVPASQETFAAFKAVRLQIPMTGAYEFSVYRSGGSSHTALVDKSGKLISTGTIDSVSVSRGDFEEGDIFYLILPQGTNSIDYELSAMWTVPEEPCPKGGSHDWHEEIRKATFSADGGLYMACGKCGKEEFVTPFAAVTKVKLSKTAYTYSGKAFKPKVTVINGFGDLLDASQYTVTYADNKNAGTAKVTVTMTSDWYEGTKDFTFRIKKAANPLSAKGKTVTVKYASLSKKAKAIARKSAITLSKAKGTVTYAKVSGNKKITIDKKTGKITVAKGLKKGVYSVKIKVKAAGTGNYKALAQTVTVKVKIA